MITRPKLYLLYGLLGCLLPTVHAAESERDLTELSLEALMSVEVTSAAKRQQPLSDTAAAIHVITREEIRRSGMTTIPELLRLVPGVHVARIDANKWAISSRGFLDRFSNKMLVLIDGRTVYTPLFAGVYWDVQDTVLEDIERIEVIRGPGATLWGANAVNGVINIVTRDAGDTHGGLATVAGGTHETQAVVRYGGGTEDLDWRAFARFIDHSAFLSPAGGDASDAYDVSRAGFRIDWTKHETERFTFQGNVYDGDAGEATVLPVLGPPYAMPVSSDIALDGYYLQGQWRHKTSDSSSFSLQAYFDSTSRNEIRGTEDRDTFDVDFNLQKAFRGHNVVWGLGVRRTSDRVGNTLHTNLTPASKADMLYSAFVQDDLEFDGGKTRITFGSKFEHNDYTGFELQPNFRVFRKIGNRHAIWAALSRAIRSPARAFQDATIFLAAFPDPVTTMTTVVGIEGNPNLESEELQAFEFGYRLIGSERVTVDFSTFYNDYDNLNSMEAGLPRIETVPVLFVFVPQLLDNLASGESFGSELSANWRISDRYRLFFGHTFLDLDLTADPSSTDLAVELQDGNSPQHQFQVRSYFDVAEDWTLDLAAYYVDELPNLGVDDYTRVDLRAAWNPSDRLALSLAFQNILDDEHLEFADFLVPPVLIERSAIAKVSWKF